MTDGPGLRRLAARLGVALVLAAPLAAQAGDREDEEQRPLPAGLDVPPAPALAPAGELATFSVADGLTVELVCAEPLVRDPVAMAFDSESRLWVVEMRGYMPDVDGTGELEPTGSIAVLSDTDGDGAMDERAVFLDGLVLPRAVAPWRDGALVIAPPEMFFARDTDGDGRADEREVIETGLAGRHNPEHAINGLLYTLDGWFHCANHPWRYRERDGAWERERTSGSGQWGVTQDDEGRIFFNTNSDPLRADPFPSSQGVRNSHLGRAAGLNVQAVREYGLWPERMNPGVNRGYRAGLLDGDLRLTRMTAACAPWIHRGDALGMSGDAFVCEPAGNLVKRFTLQYDNRGRPSGRDAYAGRELLASTDERFRPVALTDGPDGALYVADMYRGLIQHRVFVTTFLRRQVEARGLERPIGRGRIWRVRRADHERPEPRRLADASWTDLVGLLDAPNAFWRHTAQRLIVEEGAESEDARELLRARLARGGRPAGTVHALWALEGIGWMDADHVRRALDDRERSVRFAAIRLAEPFLGDEAIRARLRSLAAADGPRARHQVLLSFGAAATGVATAELAGLLAVGAPPAEDRDAAVSGLFGRELEMLEHVLDAPAWSADGPGRVPFVESLARCVAVERSSERIERAIELALAAPEHYRGAIARGLVAGGALGPDGATRHLALAREPRALDRLEALRDEHPDAPIAALARCLRWPGGPGADAGPRPLTDAERERFERGRVVFHGACATCHQPSGLGEPGRAPPLRDSPWVLGPDLRLARVVLHGLEGRIEMAGDTWDLEMPAYDASDEDLAAVLTYLRREWGHAGEPVTPARIAEVRALDADRVGPWHVEDLEENGER